MPDTATEFLHEWPHRNRVPRTNEARAHQSNHNIVNCENTMNSLLARGVPASVLEFTAIMAYTEHEYFNENARYQSAEDDVGRLWEVLRGDYKAVNDVELETPQHITGYWCELTKQPKPFGLGTQDRKNRFAGYVYQTRRSFNMNEQLVDVILGNKTDVLDKSVSDARRVNTAIC